MIDFKAIPPRIILDHYVAAKVIGNNEIQD